MIRKTTEQIIDETVEFYSNNPRAVIVSGSHTMCVYHDKKTGNKCALGRCMNSNWAERLGGETFILGNMKLVVGVSLDESLKPEYRGQKLEFWDALQRFHDTGQNWGEQGLTETGKSVVARLKNEWCKDGNGTN